MNNTSSQDKQFDEDRIIDETEIRFIDPYDLVDFEPESETTAEEAARTEQVDRELEEILPVTESLESAEEYIIKRQEDTRGRLAMIYLIATFLVFLMGFVVAILDAIMNQTSIIANLREILPLISGIFLGSLGFVLGYYFRKDEENNK